MAKRFLILVLILLAAAELSVKSYTFAYEPDLSEQFYDAVPNAYKDILDDDIEAKADHHSLVKEMLEVANSSLGNALHLFISVIAIVLLYALLDSLSSGSESIKNTCLSIFCITIITLCFNTVRAQMETIKQAVETMNVFTGAAVPVISMVCIASGESFSSAVFSSAVSSSSYIFSRVTSRCLMPLVVLYLSFGVVSQFSGGNRMTALHRYIKRIIRWGVGVYLAVFTLSFSLQSFLSRSADSVLKRSIRTAVGSFVPVIGSTLTGGVDQMFTLAANTKTTFAVTGILVILLVFLPAIIGSASYGLILNAAKAFASFLEVKKAEAAIGVIAEVFLLLCGICCAGVFLVMISYLLICINL